MEWSTGTWKAAEHSIATAAAAAQLALGALPPRLAAAALEVADSYDEQPQLHASEIGGIPYFVETNDGRRFSGRATMEGTLPRVETYSGIHRLLGRRCPG